MLTIYSTPDWLKANSYQKYDAVRYNARIYYALQDIPANTDFSTDYFGGVLTVGSEIRPEFLWTPSFNAAAEHNPRTRAIQYGDGYEQRAEDGINNQLLVIEFPFELRTLQEASAILHFLYSQRGVDLFWFVPPAPYSERKRFICKQWSHNEIFVNNHSVRAKFEERPA